MEWLDIKEFNGRYEVSDTGIVRNSSNKREIPQHIINSGYLKVNIKYKGKQNNRLVHRLVALEFCEGFSENLQVNHINAERFDNHANNLEWVTSKENVRDCMKRGTFNVSSAHKVAHARRKKKVIQRSLDGKEVNRFDSVRQASKTVKSHENSISRVCRGVGKTCEGFIWEYV